MGSPIVSGLANTLSAFPRRVLNYASQMAEPIEHGVDAARTMLGFPPTQAPPQPVDDRIVQANEAFRRNAEQHPEEQKALRGPALMQMRKPLKDK